MVRGPDLFADDSRSRWGDDVYCSLVSSPCSIYAI